MITTLLRKELQQHWLALLLVALLTLAGNVLFVGLSLVLGESGSLFESLGNFLRFLVPLCSLVLSHRLVAAEYAGKTQLFLEALPVSRWKMVAVKYGVGLGLVAGIVLFVLGGACVLGAQREAFTPRFVMILAAKALSAAWFAYSFFFLMGFVGRYRLALYAAVLLGAAALDLGTHLQLQRFGPLALLNERFAFERDHFPWEALRVTWALAGACVLLAFTLGLTREGNVAALLAERMSHREKIFVAALLVGLMSAFAVLDEKKERAPFDLHDAITEQRAGVVVKVSQSEGGGEDEARRLAGFLAGELSAAADYLGIAAFPPVFVTRRRDLDANRFECGELEKASGVHVQANFGATDFSRADFSAWLLREVLIVATDGRAKLERRMWVLDGFAPFWEARSRTNRPLAEEKRLSLRALYASAQGGFEWVDLERWHRYRDRVGSEMAGGLAWSGLQTLARRQGPERTRRFLRAALGARVPKDVRAWFRERSAPIERLLEREAGLSRDLFWQAWEAELARARVVLATELDELPRLRGAVSLVPLGGDSVRVRYRLELDGGLAAPSGRYSFLYHELPAFDAEVPPPLLRREQHALAARTEAELAESITRGSRLYWTFSMEVPALGCAVISGWRREEVD